MNCAGALDWLCEHVHLFASQQLANRHAGVRNRENYQRPVALERTLLSSMNAASTSANGLRGRG